MPGSAVVEVDGVVVRDLIDWRWLTDGNEITVTVQDAQGARREFDLDRAPTESWGIEFDDPLFDRIHTCRNDCVFCFMAQLPEGPAPGALHPRRRLPPVVSARQLRHAHQSHRRRRGAHRSSSVSRRCTSLCTRSIPRFGLVSCARIATTSARALRPARARRGSHLHVQIVLVPGINDGEELDRTLEWLARASGGGIGRNRAAWLHALPGSLLGKL